MYDLDSDILRVVFERYSQSKASRHFGIRPHDSKLHHPLASNFRSHIPIVVHVPHVLLILLMIAYSAYRCTYVCMYACMYV